MDIELVKEKEIPLLKRKRVTLKYNSQDQKTPSRLSMIKEVAKKLGVKEDTVAIRHIYTRFGISTSKIIAHVYKDKATKDQYENKKLLAKQDALAKKESDAKAKPAEETTVAPKEEAPAEGEEPKADEAEKPAETEAPKEESAPAEEKKDD